MGGRDAGLTMTWHGSPVYSLTLTSACLVRVMLYA